MKSYLKKLLIFVALAAHISPVVAAQRAPEKPQRLWERLLTSRYVKSAFPAALGAQVLISFGLATKHPNALGKAYCFSLGTVALGYSHFYAAKNHKDCHQLTDQLFELICPRNEFSVPPGSLADIQEVLRQGADPNWERPCGHTPVFYLVRKSRDIRSGEETAALISVLKDYGADVCAQDGKGCTALDFTDSSAVQKILFELGCLPGNPELYVHRAIRANNYQGVKLALDYGINCRRRYYNVKGDLTEKNGLTPLIIASAMRDLDVVTLLLSHLPKEAVNDRAYNGLTALRAAMGDPVITESDLNIVLHLLLHGARVDIPDNNGATPFMYAVTTYDVRVMELFVRFALPQITDAMLDQALAALVVPADDPEQEPSRQEMEKLLSSEYAGRVRRVATRGLTHKELCSKTVQQLTDIQAESVMVPGPGSATDGMNAFIAEYLVGSGPWDNAAAADDDQAPQIFADFGIPAGAPGLGLGGGPAAEPLDAPAPQDHPVGPGVHGEETAGADPEFDPEFD